MIVEDLLRSIRDAEWRAWREHRDRLEAERALEIERRIVAELRERCETVENDGASWRSIAREQFRELTRRDVENSELRARLADALAFIECQSLHAEVAA